MTYHPSISFPTGIVIPLGTFEQRTEVISVLKSLIKTQVLSAYGDWVFSVRNDEQTPVLTITHTYEKTEIEGGNNWVMGVME